MIAVGVRVHHRGDRSPGEVVGHGPEHLAGQTQIEEGVDEQRLVATEHETGVAPAPPAVGLQVGEHVRAHGMESSLIGNHAVYLRPDAERCRACVG